MRVLVTGGAGHIGNNVVRALAEDGHQVRCLIRSDDEALSELHVERVRGNLLDRDSIRAAVSGMDAVVHSAAFVGLNQSEAERMQAINVDGTRTLLEEASAARARRFIHFSSVHGLRQEPLDEPLSETNALADTPTDHPYDRTKAQSETLVLNHACDTLKTSILNPTAVLGPYDFKPSRLGRVVYGLGNGKMPMLVDSGFDFVDVRDIARATVQVLVSEHHKERFLLGGSWASFKTLAEMAGRVGGKPASRIYLPLSLASSIAPLGDLWRFLTGRSVSFSRGSLYMLVHQNPRVDCEKAKRELHHTPRSLEETVRDTLTWWEGRI